MWLSQVKNALRTAYPNNDNNLTYWKQVSLIERFSLENLLHGSVSLKHDGA